VPETTFKAYLSLINITNQNQLRFIPKHHLVIFVSTLTSHKTGSIENLLGKNIRAFREALGLLQRQVAYHLDIDSPMLSNIE
jgi:DNA-binding transcriptional regulator YiaG